MIGSLNVLLALAPKLRDFRDLGIGIISTPAAGSRLLAVDGDGIMVADGSVEIAVGRHAMIQMEDGRSPPELITIDFWSRNLVALRSERYVRFAKRANAAAWAEFEAEA